MWNETQTYQSQFITPQSPSLCVCSVRSAWGQWRRPWSSWINQMRVCLTRSSFSTLAHAYWRLETESQSALKPTATQNTSSYGEGKKIIWCLRVKYSPALLCWWSFCTCCFLAETFGYLCQSLQNLELGSFTNSIKWHRRSDHTRRRQVVPVFNTHLVWGRCTRSVHH